MAEYKKIIGTAVQTVDGDPDNPVKGQLWYNSQTAEFNYQKQNYGSAWSAVAPVNTGRSLPGGAGIQTAAIMFGGETPAPALSADTDTVLFPEQYKPVLLARARYYIYQFKDNIAQSQLALDEYKKGLQNMADNLNSPQPQYMSDVRFTYLLP